MKLKRGDKTSEYRTTQKSIWIGVIALILPFIFKELSAQDAQMLAENISGAIVQIAGGINIMMAQTSYARSRTEIKVAEQQAKVDLGITND